MSTKLTKDIFINRAKVVHGHRFDYSFVKYLGSEVKIRITCNVCKHIWDTLPHVHLNGHGCPKCSVSKRPQCVRRSQDDFFRTAREVQGDNFTYLSPYMGANSKIDLKCNKCGRLFSQIAKMHLLGYKCQKCSGVINGEAQRITYDEFEKRAKEVHNDTYVYFNDYVGSNKKVKIYCRKHKNHFFQTPNSHLRGRGCPRCRESFGEKSVAYFLTLLKVKFDREKTFEKCVGDGGGKLKFDFYLVDYNSCIEYDGAQHFYAHDAFGGKEKFLQTQRHDKVKNVFCSSNGVNLLRISWNDIKNISSIVDDFIKSLKCEQ